MRDHIRPIVRRATGTAVALAMQIAARDGTGSLDDGLILVLAPHPDDEVLGCGATIMRKLDAGGRVIVAIASDGGRSTSGDRRDRLVARRSAELAEAGRRLGLHPDDVVEFGFPDGQLAAHRRALTDRIRDLVAAHQPVTVYCTSPADPHPDHAELGRAAFEALAGTQVRLLSYPIWQWDHPRTWSATMQGQRPELVKIGSYKERKRHVIQAHGSQLSEEAGGDHPLGMGPGFLRWFLRRVELFVPAPLPSSAPACPMVAVGTDGD